MRRLVKRSVVAGQIKRTTTTTKTGASAGRAAPREDRRDARQTRERHRRAAGVRIATENELDDSS